MSQYLEFVQNHPYLFTAAAVLIGLIIGNEIRLRLRGVEELSPGEATRRINDGAAVIDVRDAERFRAGHLPGAKQIPAAAFGEREAELARLRDRPVIVYCNTGAESARAAARLRKEFGLEQAATLKGGLTVWQRENMPVEKGKK